MIFDEVEDGRRVEGTIAFVANEQACAPSEGPSEPRAWLHWLAVWCLLKRRER